MIGVVVYKRGERSKILEEILSEVEEVELRGIGRAHRYEFRHRSLYFVPVLEDFQFNGRKYEKRIFHSVGRPSFILSLRFGDTLLLHATGNITNTNPFLHPSFSPKTISPTDPDLLGTLFLALHRAGMNPHIAAVHDPPGDLTIPHISLKTPPDLIEDIIPTIIASFRRKKIFIPYITVSRAFTADYFLPLILKRHVPAYHIPYYWYHHLDESLFKQAAEKSGVRAVLVERGLVLPGEFPKKEV